jgi:energy-coupling factor transport system substrate-specific component
MTEEEIVESEEEEAKPPFRENLRAKISGVTLRTLAVSVLGALIFLLLEMIPWPYLAIDLFPIGFIPALAVVAAVGAMKGPLAGFLTGYLGTLLSDIILSRAITVFTLYGAAIGVLGLIVGLASYEFDKGRSLAKLSLMSLIGLVFTTLLTVVFGLYVERIASLAAIGFQLLPLLTRGIPTVVLLTPLFARIWHHMVSNPPEENGPEE